jgi:hypothetical protein
MSDQPITQPGQYDAAIRSFVGTTRALAKTEKERDEAVAAVKRCEALPRHMVAAWLVGPKEGEERLTSVYAVRWDDLMEALGVEP